MKYNKPRVECDYNFSMCRFFMDMFGLKSQSLRVKLSEKLEKLATKAVAYPELFLALSIRVQHINSCRNK